MMGKRKRKNTVDARISTERRGEGIVPALPSSSSDDGPPGGLRASPPGENAIATKRAREEKKGKARETARRKDGEEESMEGSGSDSDSSESEYDPEDKWSGLGWLEWSLTASRYRKKEREERERQKILKDWWDDIEGMVTREVIGVVGERLRNMGLEDLSREKKKVQVAIECMAIAIQELADRNKVLKGKAELLQKERDNLAALSGNQLRRAEVAEGKLKGRMGGQERATQTDDFLEKGQGEVPYKAETRGVAVQAAPRVKNRGNDPPGKGAFGDRGLDSGVSSWVDALNSKVEALAREIRSLARDLRGSPAAGRNGGEPTTREGGTLGAGPPTIVRLAEVATSGGKGRGGVGVSAAPVLAPVGREPGRGDGGVARRLPPTVGGGKKAEAARLALPKTAAVVITVLEGGAVSYAEALRSVREKVSLADLGIGSVKC